MVVDTTVLLTHDDQTIDTSILDVTVDSSVFIVDSAFGKIVADVVTDSLGNYVFAISDSSGTGDIALQLSDDDNVAAQLGLGVNDVADGTSDAQITGTAALLASNSYSAGQTPVRIAADPQQTLLNLIEQINASGLGVTALQSGTDQISVIYHNNGLGANYNIVDTAINSAGGDELYFLHDTGNGYQLHFVDRDSDFG